MNQLEDSNKLTFILHRCKEKNTEIQDIIQLKEQKAYSRIVYELVFIVQIDIS